MGHLKFKRDIYWSSIGHLYTFVGYLPNLTQNVMGVAKNGVYPQRAVKIIDQWIQKVLNFQTIPNTHIQFQVNLLPKVSLEPTVSLLLELEGPKVLGLGRVYVDLL